MRQPQRIGVLVSGGLDSAVLLCRLAPARRLLPLYLRCGLRWEAAEMAWLRRFLQAVRTPQLEPLCCVDVPVRRLYGAHWSLTGRQVPSATSRDRAVYLPGRNLLLLSHAAIAAVRRGYATLALGILGSNPFGDASPRFLTRLAAGLGDALERPIRILTPLRRDTKPALIRHAAGAPLALTFSCLNPAGLRHCGRCNKCAERQRAFRAARVADPTDYVR